MMFMKNINTIEGALMKDATKNCEQTLKTKAI
jgi:hypothetical protein